MAGSRRAPAGQSTSGAQQSQDKPTASHHPEASVSAQSVTTASLESERGTLLAELQEAVASSKTQSHTPKSGEDDERQDESNPDVTMETAQDIIKRHIKLLHDYNAVRDVGQGLMGILAEQRGVRLVEVMEEFGVGKED
ncbi:MAG: hypothetical protein M1831_000787 [Alyxoria varia]|nr:MAG: hypothetical protein M1831_000787 [Alyxoria varia]